MINNSEINVRVAILTISDRAYRGTRQDLSGQALVKAINESGWEIVEQGLLPDEIELIKRKLMEWADTKDIDLILTTGGTGFGVRDMTPEATLAIIERATPGLVEAMRAESVKVTSHAMLSRAVAGIRSRTLIVNLPGSPKAAVENFRVIIPAIPHAVELLRDVPTAESGHRKLDRN